MNVSFLGLGAMGSRMAANLLKQGVHVTVWNRTAAAAIPLVQAGARLAATPFEAAANADVVISMVRDDDASRRVWCDMQLGALAAMKSGAIAIESSTLSLAWIRELHAAAKRSGVSMLEAPVSGSRPQAEAAQLVYLVGGDAETLAKVRPTLAAMGSMVHHVGPVGAGTLTKLATNSLLGIQVTAYAEIIGMFEHNGVDVGKALNAIAGTSVWAPVAGYLAGTMVANEFRPQFPIELIEKDFGYTIDAGGSEDRVPTVTAARSVFRDAIGHGLGDQNMTAVVRLYKETSI